MILGLNSSGWASDWSLDELIDHAAQANLPGIELQLGTDHGVSTELNTPQREHIERQVADAPVALIGLATEQRVDHVDAEALADSVQRLRAVMRLSHDIGGFGVVLGARQLAGDSEGRAIDRIAAAVRELAAFGQGWGQQVRLELGEDCAAPSVAHRIFEAVDHPNASLCWASRPENLSDEGFDHDFNALSSRLGETVYIGRLDDDSYPYFDLLRRLQQHDYHHWVLLRTRRDAPENVDNALGQQRRLFARIVDPGRDTEIRMHDR